MVNKKITDLTNLPTPVAADVIAIVDDVGGAGVATKKATLSNALAAYDNQTSTLENKSIDLTDNTLTGTSAELATAISDETGSGLLVFGTSPTLITPVLGTLTINANKIESINAGVAIELAPKTTGVVTVIGNTNDGAITLNCTSNSHGQTIKSQPHSATATNTMLLPLGANSTLVSLVSTDTLTNKTLTSPVLTTPTLGTPASGTFTTCTGLPIIAGTTGTLSVARGGTGVTGSTGSGSVVLSASPTFTGTATTASLDVAGNNIDNVQNIIHDVSTTTTTLDFNADQLQEITAGGTLTFGTTSNKGTGKSKTIKIYASGLRTLNMNASWKFIGVEPTSIASGKTAILTLTCFGTAETDCVAAYAVEA